MKPGFFKCAFLFAWLFVFSPMPCPIHGSEIAEEQISLSYDEFSDIEVKKHKKKKKDQTDKEDKKDRKDKKEPKIDYQWPVAVAAIFQQEAPYLKEWIEYHKMIGVKHFYLYNNLSTDHYNEVLAPYLKKGEVDLIEWPYQANTLSEWDLIQVSAYRDAIQLAKGKVKWLAIIDLDEFIVPGTEDNLYTCLNKHCAKGLGGACLIWSFFGTSGVEKIPEDKLLIETLTLHSGPAAGGNMRDIWNQGAYKSIVRPEYVADIPSPHYCQYVKGRSHSMLQYEIVHINHYWSRDKDYFDNVKIPRRKAWSQDSDSVRAWEAGMNNLSDGNPILRFVPALKKRLNFQSSTTFRSE